MRRADALDNNAGCAPSRRLQHQLHELQCPLMAISGHSGRKASMSAYDPKRTRDYKLDTRSPSTYIRGAGGYDMPKAPTIQDFFKQFPDDDTCLDYLMQLCSSFGRLL